MLAADLIGWKSRDFRRLRRLRRLQEQESKAWHALQLNSVRVIHLQIWYVFDSKVTERNLRNLRNLRINSLLNPS